MIRRTLQTSVLALLAVAALAGCKNVSPARVVGKAMPGEVSFIGIVPDNDPRLEQPGLADVEIRLTARGGKLEGMPIGQGKSDRDGSIRLTVTEQDAVKNPVEIRAVAPGHAPAESRLLIPSQDKRVLVILRPVPTDPR